MQNRTPPDPEPSDAPDTAAVFRRRLWPFAVVACGVLVALTAATWLLFTAPPSTTDDFVIVSSPSGADVQFDGAPLGPSPVKLDRVSVGLHRLRIFKEGFVSFDDNVRVDLERDGPLRITLKPIAPEGSAARTTDEQISEFSRLAQTAFNRGALVDPYLNSALYYADAILSIDATNQAAADMRARIRERLLETGHRALERREYTRAKAVFQQLLAAFPGDPEGGAGLEAARDPAHRPPSRPGRP